MVRFIHNKHFIVTVLSFVILFAFLVRGLANGFKIVNWISFFTVSFAIILIAEIVKYLLRSTKYADVAKKVTLYMQSMAFLSAYSAFGVIVSYCVAWGNTPVSPNIFIYTDRLFFGYSWQTLIFYLSQHSFFVAVLNFFYDSIAVLPFALIGFSIADDNAVNIFYFFEFMFVTSAVTMIIFWLIPVVGLHTNYNFVINNISVPSLQAAFDKAGVFTFGMHSIDGFNLIKNKIGDYYMTGIVSFPSYHVVLAAGLMYFAKKFKPLIRYAFYILGVGMIVSAVVIGGHYLIDIAAGLIITNLTILLIFDQRTQMHTVKNLEVLRG
ncbi:MAG: phosphatase PAP2 family protein [Conexivisphaerales archaeon]